MSNKKRSMERIVNQKLNIIVLNHISMQSVRAGSECQPEQPDDEEEENAAVVIDNGSGN